jgi:hypothetical protein
MLEKKTWCKGKRKKNFFWMSRFLTESFQETARIQTGGACPDGVAGDCSTCCGWLQHVLQVIATPLPEQASGKRELAVAWESVASSVRIRTGNHGNVCGFGLRNGRTEAIFAFANIEWRAKLSSRTPDERSTTSEQARTKEIFRIINMQQRKNLTVTVETHLVSTTRVLGRSFWELPWLLHPHAPSSYTSPPPLCRCISKRHRMALGVALAGI